VTSELDLVEFLSLECDSPLPGAVVSAEVRTGGVATVDLGYSWSLDGRLLPGGEPTLVIPKDARRGQLLRVTVAATDGRREATMAAELEIADQLPRWVSLAIDPGRRILPGTELRATVGATDPDGDALHYEYQWSVNDDFVEGARLVTFDTAGLVYGDRIEVEVVVSNEGFGSGQSGQLGGRGIDNARRSNCTPRRCGNTKTTWLTTKRPCRNGNVIRKPRNPRR
jgi:hypothetical protein